MALYLGNNKCKINLNSNKCRLHLAEKAPVINGTVLLSSENYILKDSNNVYLTVKESE